MVYTSSAFPRDCISVRMFTVQYKYTFVSDTLINRVYFLSNIGSRCSARYKISSCTQSYILETIINTELLLQYFIGVNYYKDCFGGELFR